MGFTLCHIYTQKNDNHPVAKLLPDIPELKTKAVTSLGHTAEKKPGAEGKKNTYL
jgi:hypothetical protein